MFIGLVAEMTRARVFISLLIVTLIGTTLIFESPVSAAKTNKAANSIQGINAKVVINGELQSMVQPVVYIKNGELLVPLKELFEKLGAKIIWDQATKTATIVKLKTTAKITLGTKEVYLNDDLIELSSKVESINGRIMVPMRLLLNMKG